MRFFLLLCCFALLVACQPEPEPSLLEQIQQSKKLIVLTRNAPTTYYQDRDGWTGYEYELVTAFAKHLAVEVEFKIYDSTDAVLEALKNAEGHIAAAGLTHTDEREAEFLFSPSYLKVQQELLCNRQQSLPKDLDSVGDRQIMVVSNSSYAQRLSELKQYHPTLTWQESKELNSERLIEKVAAKEIDCVVADSNIVAINRRYYPRLRVAFPVSQEQDLAWAMPLSANALQAELHTWLRTPEQNQLLADLEERYYGYAEIFDYVDTRSFLRRIDSHLPKYRAEFEAAAAKYDLPWTLLAAQAYQESHWNPNAKSPTGVRGLMMLTRITAKELGVKDRLNPRESIHGGSKYLSKLMKRLPDDLQGEERTWQALAAYNVGMGHLRDARKLTAQREHDPNQWRELKEVLPLLSQRRYYKKLKYGYARGAEPVHYVQRIRDYQNLLENHLSAEQKIEHTETTTTQ